MTCIVEKCYISVKSDIFRDLQKRPIHIDFCVVLQCVAVCCSVLQSHAVCCNVLQCVAVGCSVLQCVAVWCSVYVDQDMAYARGQSNCLERERKRVRKRERKSEGHGMQTSRIITVLISW